MSEPHSSGIERWENNTENFLRASLERNIPLKGSKITEQTGLKDLTRLTDN